MSVTLHVKLRQGMLIKDLPERVSTAFAHLLPGIVVPAILATLESGAAVDEQELTPDGPTAIFSLEGREEQARVMPLLIPIQEKANAGDYAVTEQPYASIDWYRAKTAVCWALVASLSIAVAEAQNAVIEDYGSFFMMGDCYSPKDLIETLQVKEHEADLESAAAALVLKIRGFGVSVGFQGRSPE